MEDRTAEILAVIPEALPLRARVMIATLPYCPLLPTQMIADPETRTAEIIVGMAPATRAAPTPTTVAARMVPQHHHHRHHTTDRVAKILRVEDLHWSTDKVITGLQFLAEMIVNNISPITTLDLRLLPPCANTTLRKEDATIWVLA